MRGRDAERYLAYAKECLRATKFIADREARLIQRQMAAEWLKLAGPAEDPRDGMQQAAE